MTTRTVTLRLPESLYTRFQQTARATRRSLDELLLHAVEVGSPPRWEDAPAEFQADLAALDRLEDEALWRIARSRKTEADMERYQELLDKNANDLLLRRFSSFPKQVREERAYEQHNHYPSCRFIETA